MLAQFVRAFLVAATLVLGQAAASAQTIPGVAARVNGVAISNLRLERHFEDFLVGKRRNVGAMINPQVYKKLKREALDQLIERELLWQAAQADGIVASDDDVRAALKQIEDRLGSGDALLRRLERAGFDETSYTEYTRHELSGAQFLVQRSAAPPSVDDAEVAAFYERNRHRFQRPEPVPPAELQEAIRARLLAEKRTALAREVVAALRANARIDVLLDLN